MKKLLLAFFIIVPTIAFSQEIYLRCIGDNVNVRKGPGTKYAVEQLHGGVHCGFGKAQLFRGEILIWDGKQQNLLPNGPFGHSARCGHGRASFFSCGEWRVEMLFFLRKKIQI